jgi:isocitrate dehydrogenase
VCVETSRCLDSFFTHHVFYSVYYYYYDDSRDTIHIEGIELGYKNPVFFERHAVGGEYAAGWAKVGKGTLLTTYMPSDPGSPPFVVDKRDLKDNNNVVVVYDNPYDNVTELAHLFFQRCLTAKVTPYVVTKKTVFKWQEGFWATMKAVFDADYKEDYLKAGLLQRCGGDLQHLISDAATMQLIRWTDGGFGMAAHNYDGDMLTDQIAQVHRSPGFITSNLVGKNDDGTLIKEFEASHGTVSDLWHDHLAGKETSLNPLGLVEAMIGALEHAATLDVERNPGDDSKVTAKDQIVNFTSTLRMAIHNTFRYGQGTRDMSGPSGYTTEDFISKVAWRLQRYLASQGEEMPPPVLREPDRRFRRNYDVDDAKVKQMFASYDRNGDGHIDYDEFTKMIAKLGLAPKKSLNDKTKLPDV